MPIYDYRCKECNTLYDILHKGKEIIEDIQCPACGSRNSTKLMSIPSVIAKGPSSDHCNMGACQLDRSSCGCKCECN